MATGISFDLGTFSLNLKKLENLHRNQIDKALDRIGDFVSKEAKLRAPVYAGNLTEDIEQNIQGDAVIIRVPENSPSSNYAIPMHEHEYNLGDESAQKQAKGFEVGRKFITRAIDDNQDAIMEIAKNALKL